MTYFHLKVKNKTPTEIVSSANDLFRKISLALSLRKPPGPVVYCLSGIGALVTERGEMAFGADDAIFVDPDIIHSFKNTGNETLKFLCLIPHEKPIIKKALNPFADEEANNC